MLLHKPGRKSLKVNVVHHLWAAALDYEEDIILTGCTEEEAFLHECQTIVAYGRIDLKTGCLANQTDGGDGSSGRSEESRKRTGAKLKGRPPSEKALQKLMERNVGNTFGSFIRTEAMRKNLSEALTGRIRSEEHKRNISEAKKGHTISEETRKKMSESHKGLIRSEEHRKRLSEALRGRVRSEEHKNNLSKALQGRIAPNKGGTSWIKGHHHSEETLKKIGDGNRGKFVSEETRERLSTAFKGRTRSDGHWVKLEIIGKGL